MDHVEELIDILKNERLWSSKSTYFLLKPLNFSPFHLENNLGCLSTESGKYFHLGLLHKEGGVTRHSANAWQQNDIEQNRNLPMISLSADSHSAKCHSAKCHFVKCHSTECHSCKCHSGKCHSGKCHSGKCHSGKCHSAKCHSAKCHSAKYHAVKCHSAKCRSAKCHSTNLTLHVSPSIEHAIMWSVIQQSVAMPHVMAPRDPSQV